MEKWIEPWNNEEKYKEAIRKQVEKRIKQFVKLKEKESVFLSSEEVKNRAFCYYGYYFDWTYIISATDDELKNKIRKIAREQLNEYVTHFAKCVEEINEDEELCFISNNDGLFVSYVDSSDNKQSRIICTHDDFERCTRLIHDLDYPEKIVEMMRYEASLQK